MSPDGTLGFVSGFCAALACVSGFWWFETASIRKHPENRDYRRGKLGGYVLSALFFSLTSITALLRLF